MLTKWLAAAAAAAVLAGGCASGRAAPAAHANETEAAPAVPLPPLPSSAEAETPTATAAAEPPDAPAPPADSPAARQPAPASPSLSHAAAPPAASPPPVHAPSAPTVDPAAAADHPPSRTPASDAGLPEVIVLDEGGGSVRPSPGELARATRRQAATRPGTPPRITNENLADYARGARVSIAGPAPAPPGEDAASDAAASNAAEAPRGEAYWRGRAREIREEWRRTLDDIEELESAAADLRWQFYAEDDPWVRDGRIKPEWDRVLDRLSEARNDLATFPRRLEALREEGRREGALPGWLREGIELEPTAEELAGGDADPAEPIEPPEVDEGPPGEPR